MGEIDRPKTWQSAWYLSKTRLQLVQGDTALDREPLFFHGQN
jgi:hypothetical protein